MATDTRAFHDQEGYNFETEDLDHFKSQLLNVKNHRLTKPSDVTPRVARLDTAAPPASVPTVSRNEVFDFLELYFRTRCAVVDQSSLNVFPHLKVRQINKHIKQLCDLGVEDEPSASLRATLQQSNGSTLSNWIKVFFFGHNRQTFLGHSQSSGTASHSLRMYVRLFIR